MRRVGLLVIATCAPVACGLGYSPGDFLAREVAAPADAATPVVDSGVVDAFVPDAAPPAPAPLHVMIFGGLRAPTGSETGSVVAVSETMLTTIAEDGTLGPWSYDEPPPALQGACKRALLAGGKIFLEAPGIFASAAFDATGPRHVTSAWAAASFGLPPNSINHGWMVDPLAFHASSALTTTQYTASVESDGGVGAWTASAATASVSRADATIVRVGNFVYALGGATSPILKAAESDYTVSSKVEVAPYTEATGMFGDFTTSGTLATADGGVYEAFAPVVGASATRIVVAGGATDTGGTPTNLVLTAAVANPDDGSLGPWQELAPLPEPLGGFALVVTDEAILVIGGQDAKGAFHDEILANAGADWTQIGKLPEKRSGLAAVTF